ncbi:HK97-gp10 family putative phage morphogenesis protein [Andreprevotia chitinilytica]|uniref:HK97-gp10 family putative phage morphogenesis protein n=1 Tax=Andreprevotia chitinilytica TaxID=396808 RepID=UPI0005503605|nr:HK97-gp10 family putative phage morphogenesis protein [Andreprevotia chitinilytica]
MSKIHGLAELTAKLNSLSDKAGKKAVQKALGAGAKPIVKEIRRRVPKDTGFLRKQINARKSRSKLLVQIGVRLALKPVRGDKGAYRIHQRAKISPAGRLQNANAFYWYYLEFGTSKMAAQPFMQPGFDAKKDDALDAIVDSLRRDVNEAIR